jgi:integrase
LAKGVHKVPTKQTIGEYLSDDWLPGLAAAVAGGSLKPTTEDFYRTLVTQHIIPNIGGVALAHPDKPALDKLYTYLLTTPRANGQLLSRTTVHAVHRTLRKALSDAVRAGTLSRNAATHANAPQPVKVEMSVWDASQLRVFAASVAEDRTYALWQLAMSTGLRRGELAGLRWEDLDLGAGRLRVVVTRTVVSYRVVDGDPKSATSKRAIGLDPGTVAALRAHKARQAAERLAWGPAWTDNGFVFVQEDGQPYHPQRLSKMFAQAARKAKLPLIRLHDLRHSYATAGLEAGVPLLVMSRRLGHSSLAITADTYLHVLPQVDQDAADRTAAYIFGPR